MTVPCSSIQTQTVPGVSDPDPGASLSISYSQTSPTTTLSTTTSFGVMTLKVSPTTLAEVGTHTVTFIVSDSYNSASISFTITVTNSAPYFTSAFSSTYTAYLN